MSQTKYPIEQGVAQAGLLVDLRDHTIESYSAEGPVGFGLAVIEGSSNRQCEIPDAAGNLLGVTVHTHAVEQDSVGVSQYGDTETAGVLRKGLIWVPVSTPVQPGDPASYLVDGTGRFSTGTGTSIPTASFRSEADADELAQLEINLP